MKSRKTFFYLYKQVSRKYKSYSTVAVLQLNSSTEYQDEKLLQSTDHSAYLHFTVFVTTAQQQPGLL